MKKDRAFSADGFQDLIRADGLYRLVLAVLLAVISYIFLGSYIRLPEFRGVHLLTCGFVLLFLGLFVSAKGKMKLFTAAFFAAVLIIWSSIFQWKRLWAGILSYPSWAFFGELEEKELLPFCESIQVVILSVLSFFAAWLIYERTVVKAVLSLLLFAGLIAMMFSGGQVSHIGTVFVILLLVMSLSELLRKYSKKQKTGSPMRYLLYLMPVFLLYGALVFMMPVSEDPYDWKGFRSAYQAIEEGFRKLSSRLVLNRGKGYIFSYSGFSENAVISGNVRSSEQENLEISSSGSFDSSIYLAGIVMNRFDGREWENDCPDSDSSLFAMDAYETWLAVNRYDPEYMQDYIRQKEVSIKYLNIRTEALFMPQKASYLKLDQAAAPEEEQGGSYRFQRRKGYGTTYAVRFYQMNLGSPLFTELLEHRDGYWDDETTRSSYYRFGSSEHIPTASDLYRKRALAKNSFTEKPGISDELRKYLDEALAGTEPGSLERLYRIESLLSSYSYEVAPGRLPKEIRSASDFLDYFLLEKREGYCGYFATCFALLAREEGYPARYVQGFLIPAGKEKTIVIKSSMAHAWPEVYFDGIGWIPFEPTPGYSAFRYTGWTVASRDKTAGEGAGTGENAGESEVPGINGPEEVIPEDLILPPEEEEKKGFDVEILVRVLRGILAALGFLLVFFILFILSERLIRMIRLKRMSENARYGFRAERLLRVLGVIGQRRTENETLREYRERNETLILSENSEEEREKAFLFLADYEALLDGGKFREEAASQRLQTSESALFGILKRKNRLRYLIFRLIYD